jgi:hypothetical protein
VNIKVTITISQNRLPDIGMSQMLKAEIKVHINKMLFLYLALSPIRPQKGCTIIEITADKAPINPI